MNVVQLLTPKSAVAYLNEKMTLRQALDKMENHRYTCVPVLNAEGGYAGTITEGDLLWAIKNKYNLNLKNAEQIPLADIARKRDYQPVNINAHLNELVVMAMTQNFVPMVDDREAFIGIVTRKDILQYCYSNFINKEGTEEVHTS